MFEKYPNNLFFNKIKFFLQRFGCALTFKGKINLKNKKYECDFEPIETDCDCSTCKNYTKSYLNLIATREAVSSTLLSVHNIAFQVNKTNTYAQISLKIVTWKFKKDDVFLTVSTRHGFNKALLPT